jgi:Tfp pilus assembly protein PilF
MVRDRLNLSEDAKRAGAATGPAAGEAASADAEAESAWTAEETLDEILGELNRRGMRNHPRARALQALKQRLEQERMARPPLKKPEEQTTTVESEGFMEALGGIWDSLLGLVQNPDEKAAHRKILLKQIRVKTDQGDFKGAERTLKMLLARDPQDAEAHARLGRMYLDAAEPAAAEPHVKAAAELRPRDPAAQILLGEFHYQRGEPQEALVAFGKALRSKPEHSDANAWLGILAHEGDRPIEAQRFLERAISFDPNHAVARYYLAQVSLAQGDSLRARYQLDIVRKLDPAADLSRFDRDVPPGLPARTGAQPYVGWVVPKPGRLAGSPTA